MKTYQFLALACLAVLAAPPQRANSSAIEDAPTKFVLESGNDLLRSCQSTELFDRGVCGGYVTAVSQMAQSAKQACYPDGVNA